MKGSPLKGIEWLSEWTGRATMWLALILVLITTFETGERYLFNRSSSAVQELQWHIYSLIFLLGFAYTLRHDGHVRVDIFYDKMPERWKAVINLSSMVLLLIPFCVMIIGFSWDWVVKAYEIGEKSPDPGGLPGRWLLKGAIPVGFGLLLLQGIVEIVKNLRMILLGKKA